MINLFISVKIYYRHSSVKANFLGAHAVGRAYRGRQSEYVDLVRNEMLPAAAAEGLADYVDVFCDEGFFTVEETARILEKAAEYGIRPKIHANELAVSGGVQVGVRYNALSVDHLEKTTDAEIEALRGSGTMPTMLPGCSFFLGLPYGRAKDYIEAGLPVALASDFPLCFTTCPDGQVCRSRQIPLHVSPKTAMLLL